MNILNETHPHSTENAIAETLLQVEADETRRQAIRQALENVNRKGFYIEARAIVKLMKPVTWFPPMWAFFMRRDFNGRKPFGKLACLGCGFGFSRTAHVRDVANHERLL